MVARIRLCLGAFSRRWQFIARQKAYGFTSKDYEQIINFKQCLGITNKIERKSARRGEIKKYFRVQFGDVVFYKFLLSIGLKPNKTKTISEVKIPSKYFFHFLRGHFDGDGHFYSYWDPRWKASYMFYTVFNSASKKHIVWLRSKIFKALKIKGHITKSPIKICYQLKYAKKDSLKLLHRIYHSNSGIYLPRKYLKIQEALGIIGIIFK